MLTDQIEQALLELPDLCNGPVQLPEAGDHNVHSGVLAGSPFLQSEPRYSQQQPDTGGESDQDTQSPIVPLLALVHPQPEHDPHDNSQYDDLTQRLDVKSHITDLIPLHRVSKLVLLSRHLSILVLSRLLSQRSRIPRESRERGSPVRQTQLVGDQTNNVQP